MAEKYKRGFEGRVCAGKGRTRQGKVEKIAVPDLLPDHKML